MNKRRISFAFGILLALVAAIAPELSQRSTPSLLSRSKRAGAFAPGLSSGDHQWLDDHTIVASDGHQPPSRLAAFDLRTRTERPLFDLNAQPGVRPADFFMDATPDSARGSPDRRTIAWLASDCVFLIPLTNGTVRAVPHTTPVGGKAGTPVPPGQRLRWSTLSFAWIDGGKRWVGCELALGQAALLTVHAANGQAVVSKSFGAGEAVELLGTLSNHDLLLYMDQKLVEVDPRRSLTIVNTRSPQPFDGLVEPFLSPDGTRILWWVRNERDSFATAINARLLHSASVDVEGVLYISDSDGRHLREIGRQRWSTGDADDPALTEFRWLPDSRHISFVHQYSLWVMYNEGCSL